MSVVNLTVSTQLKSADTESEKENHSGKKNRGKFSHNNKDIDPKKSHLNVEFDLHDRRELLHKHYDERIEKHNKQNNSKARRWDLDKFLDTFEGKAVKQKGKDTKNQRWSTFSQISYLGANESINPVLEEIKEAGASQDEIIEAYSRGYRNYIHEHNEVFPTLPIYHSNIHFDETTPHGHDCGVVMGHTKKGRASDSINNALGEKYGYAKDYTGRTENMKKYRLDNDALIFNNITPEISQLAEKYGLEFDFKAIRTGEKDGSLSTQEYKNKKDFEAQKEDFEIKFKNKSEKLDEKAQKLSEREKRHKEDYAKFYFKEEELNESIRLNKEREKELKERERKLELENKILDKKQKELDRQNKLLAENKEKISTKQRILDTQTKFNKGVLLAILEDDPERQGDYNVLKSLDVDELGLHQSAIENTIKGSLSEVHKREKPIGSKKEDVSKKINNHIPEDEGPSM